MLFGQVDVAAIALAHGELVFMVMASEARCHRGEHRLRSRVADLDVTTHAFAVRRADMRLVLELEVLASERGARPIVG